MAGMLVMPAARLRTVLGEPSPQLMVTVCVSSVPGSVNVPDRVVLPFSLIVVALRLKLRLDGATLLTVTDVLPVAMPVSSSATVTLMV